MALSLLSTQTLGFSSVPTNPCEDKRPYDAFEAGDGYFNNIECLNPETFDLQVAEQAGVDVTPGYAGDYDPVGTPITTTYEEAGLCPVNVHWHLGTEHRMEGQYDEGGSGPHHRRKLAEDARMGFQCYHYDETDPKFTTPYEWQYCDSSMEVGQTYEVHWPHSAAGACGTMWQYQTDFYDGVFCMDGVISLDPLNTFEKIGVQAQIFTIVNSDAEEYYYPTLFDGMITYEGQDIAKYTGSTTGTSRDNEMCSRYTPITWQVDRTCHMISASSFDEMCKQMMEQADDMSHDLYAHGARELVADFIASSEILRKKK